MEFNTHLGTVMVRLFFKPDNGDEKELSYFLENFKYIYDEEGPDCCTLIINRLDATAPDLPEFQENANYRVIWGYVKGATKERKVYVKDIKWTFDKNGRKVTLECTDKSHSTKQTKTKEIHEDVDLPTLTQRVAEKHGLKAYIEVPQKKGAPATSQSLRLALADYKTKTDPNSKYGKARLSANGIQEVVGGTSGITFLRQQALYEAIAYSFKNQTIPQANRTDTHLIKKVGLKEKGGQWLAETRDDTITLKRREYNKVPYKSYRYEGGTGELFSFEPESKNKSKLGAAVNSMFSAWNAEKKEFMQGMAQANAAAYEQQVTNLAKWMKDSGFIPKTYNYHPSKNSKTLLEVTQKNTAANLLAPSSNVGPERDPSTLNDVVGTIFLPGGISANKNYGSMYPIDNTDRPAFVIQRMVTGEELKKIVKDADAAATTVSHDPHADNEDDAFANANNPRENSDLKRNPATALLWGDPNIETGEIMTIENVGIKLGGNYYNLKSTHEIAEGSGYTTALQLARNGHNIKASSNESAAKKAGRAVNVEIGQDRRTERRRRIRTNQNRR